VLPDWHKSISIIIKKNSKLVQYAGV
jgi:hypothetical protein